MSCRGHLFVDDTYTDYDAVIIITGEFYYAASIVINNII